MKLVISTIVSAIVIFLLAFIFYWGVFSAGYMSSFMNIMREPGNNTYWANIVGSLLQGFFLSIVYKYYFKGESPFKEGFMFGLLIGFLISIPYVFFMWANYSVRWKAVLADGIGMGFRFLIAGIIIGLIFGKKTEN
jgi:hypothetical protein